jgi:hypothetical protein
MGETRDSIADVWGERTPHLHNMWSVRGDERTLEEPERWVQSACVLCSNGCGLDIGVRGGKIVGVRGREVDRVNRGRLGPKGLHGFEANHSPDRLTRPLVRRDGKLVESDWEEAMALVVSRTREVCEKYTSGAVGFYNTGQLFLEEYFTLSTIIHAGLGTNNLDGNTRLCTATAAQAYKETFGSDGPPGSFTDFDECDCLLLCGHNMAFTQTVLWMRVLDRRRSDQPPKLVVIDPRETETAKEADVHLAPRVGTNVAVLNGLLRLVIENGHTDDEFIAEHTVGFEKLRRTVDSYTPEYVETLTSWDPVSKQPHFKFAAVQVRKAGAAGLSEKIGDAAGKLFDTASELTDKAMAAAHVERSHVSDYLGTLVEANEQFAKACGTVSTRHAEDAELRLGMRKLSEFSREAVERLRPFGEAYGRGDADDPSDLRSALFPSVPSGSFGLLRDLHALYVMSAEVHIALTIVMQASKELRDERLLAVCIHLDEQNKRQQAWLMTQIEHRAPHTLVVPQ